MLTVASCLLKTLCFNKDYLYSFFFSHKKFPSDEVSRVSSHDHQRNHNHRHSYQVATSAEHSIASQIEDGHSSGDTTIKNDKAITSSSARNWIPNNNVHRNTTSSANFKSASPVPYTSNSAVTHEQNDKLSMSDVGQKFYGVNQNGQVFNHTRSISGSSSEFQQQPSRSHSKTERVPTDG